MALPLNTFDPSLYPKIFLNQENSVCVYTPLVHLMPVEARGQCWKPWLTKVINGCKQQFACWELNPGLLQEQKIFLTI